MTHLHGLLNSVTVTECWIWTQNVTGYHSLPESSVPHFHIWVVTQGTAIDPGPPPSLPLVGKITISWLAWPVTTLHRTLTLKIGKALVTRSLHARCTAGPHLCRAAVLHHSPCSAGWCRECRQDWTIRLDAARLWTGRGQACCGAKPGSAGQSSSRSGPHQQQPHRTPPPLLLATFPPSQETEAAESRSEMKIWQLWERGWVTPHWFSQSLAAQIS